MNTIAHSTIYMATYQNTEGSQESQESSQFHYDDGKEDNAERLLMWDRYDIVHIPIQTAVRILKRSGKIGQSYLYNAVFPSTNVGNAATLHLTDVKLVLEKEEKEDNINGTNLNSSPNDDFVKAMVKASMQTVCQGAISQKFLSYIKDGRHAFLLGRIGGLEYTNTTLQYPSQDHSGINHNWHVLGTLTLGKDIAHFPTPVQNKKMAHNDRTRNPGKVAKVLLLCSNVSFGKLILDSIENHLRDHEGYNAIALWSLASVYSFYVDKCDYTPTDLRTEHTFTVRKNHRSGKSMAYPFFTGDKPVNGYYLTKVLAPV